jgi:hypothetical protein
VHVTLAVAMLDHLISGGRRARFGFGATSRNASD